MTLMEIKSTERTDLVQVEYSDLGFFSLRFCRDIHVQIFHRELKIGSIAQRRSRY